MPLCGSQLYIVTSTGQGEGHFGVLFGGMLVLPRTFSGMCDYSFPRLQITKTDIRQVKWAINLVIAYRPSAALRLLGSLRISHNKFLRAKNESKSKKTNSNPNILYSLSLSLFQKADDDTNNKANDPTNRDDEPVITYGDSEKLYESCAMPVFPSPDVTHAPQTDLSRSHTSFQAWPETSGNPPPDYASPNASTGNGSTANVSAENDPSETSLERNASTEELLPENVPTGDLLSKNMSSGNASSVAIHPEEAPEEKAHQGDTASGNKSTENGSSGNGSVGNLSTGNASAGNGPVRHTPLVNPLTGNSQKQKNRRRSSANVVHPTMCPVEQNEAVV